MKWLKIQQSRAKKSLSTDNVGLKTIAEIAEKIRHKEDEIQYDEDQLKNKKRRTS